MTERRPWPNVMLLTRKKGAELPSACFWVGTGSALERMDGIEVEEYMPLTEHEQRVGELEAERGDQSRRAGQAERLLAEKQREKAEADYQALREAVEEEEKRLERCIKKLSDRAWEVSDQLKKDKAAGRDEMARRGVTECAAFCEAVHLLRANLGGILNEGGER